MMVPPERRVMAMENNINYMRLQPESFTPPDIAIGPELRRQSADLEIDRMGIGVSMPPIVVNAPSNTNNTVVSNTNQISRPPSKDTSISDRIYGSS